MHASDMQKAQNMLQYYLERPQIGLYSCAF